MAAAAARRPRHLVRGRAVVGAGSGRDHPHRVFRAVGEAGNRVARGRPRRDRGLPVAGVVALSARHPLHRVARGGVHRRPGHHQLRVARGDPHPHHLRKVRHRRRWRRRRHSRRPRHLVRGRAVVGAGSGRDHPHRVFRAVGEAGNRVARGRPRRDRGLPVADVVALSARHPLHRVARGVVHRRPGHHQLRVARGDPHPHHLRKVRHRRRWRRRRHSRRPRHLVRGRAVVGAGSGRDHPHRVFRAVGEAGNRVARGRPRRDRGLPVADVVALSARHPLHRVARGVGHRRPGHHQLRVARDDPHPQHLLKVRHRRRRRRRAQPHRLAAERRRIVARLVLHRVRRRRRVRQRHRRARSRRRVQCQRHPDAVYRHLRHRRVRGGGSDRRRHRIRARRRHRGRIERLVVDQHQRHPMHRRRDLHRRGGVHPVPLQRRLLGVGQARGRRRARLRDGPAVEGERERIPRDAVAIDLACLHRPGEHQRRAARAARVSGLPRRRAQPERELRCGGHRHRGAERHGEFDDLAREVVGGARGRR